MSTIEKSRTHRGGFGLLVRSAGSRFAAVAVAVTIGSPVVAYLSGRPAVLFYVHVTLAAFWFGLDFFFKFVLGPALEETEPDAANAVNERLVPKLVVVAEPLGVGVVGSGIALAHALGYWASPSLWLWGALGIGVLMLAVGFGPLHVITTRMVAEFSSPTPDGDRLDRLFGAAMKWGFLQTVLMLAVVVMMTGLRGIIPV